jgi:hypothetical protein
MNWFWNAFDYVFKTLFDTIGVFFDWMAADFNFFYFLGGLLVAAIAIIFLVQWLTPYYYKYSERKTVGGKVLGLSYEPEESHTTCVPTFNSNGTTGIGISSSYEPEHDIVIIKCEDKKIFRKIVVDNDGLFEAVEPGDKVKIHYVEKLKCMKDNSKRPEVEEYIAETIEFEGAEYEV